MSMEIDHETWSIIYTASIFLLAFCSGMITGAYLVSRRDEKIFRYFLDDVLTEELKSDMMSKNLVEEIIPGSPPGADG